MGVKHKPNSKLVRIIITLAIIFLTGGFIGSIVEDKFGGNNETIATFQGEGTESKDKIVMRAHQLMENLRFTLLMLDRQIAF